MQAFTKKTQDDVAVDMGYDGNEMAKKPKKMELKVMPNLHIAAIS